MGKTVLVVGSGGREHALAWALARSPQVGRVWVAPGNGATRWPAGAGRAACQAVPLEVGDVEGLVDLARAGADLTVVGPEAPLEAGLADSLRQAGLRVFAPGRAAARLETSKAFARDFMRRLGIPGPHYGVFEEYHQALAFARNLGGQVAVKADGLAGGKGVVVCSSLEEADLALRRFLLEGQLGRAGRRVVLEERLEGLELSALAFCDGKTVRPLPWARDYKRAGEDDTGPNTGGMGAVAPVEGPQSLLERVLEPAVRGMAELGEPYVGFLYAGLMLTAEGPRVLEFNARLGDPEAQVLLPLLEGDLYAILESAVEGRLEQVRPLFRGCAATVVMASAGYPGPCASGHPIQGIEEAASLPDTLVFQAGTRSGQGGLETSGGRVLAVTGLGPSLDQALDRAYRGVACIRFEGAFYRRDIGRKRVRV